MSNTELRDYEVMLERTEMQKMGASPAQLEQALVAWGYHDRSIEHCVIHEIDGE